MTRPAANRVSLALCILIGLWAQVAWGQTTVEGYCDTVDEEGNLVSNMFTVTSTAMDGRALIEAPWTTVIDNGPYANRIDIVSLSEGYAVGDLEMYAAHVDSLFGFIFDFEPFRTYRHFFNLHRVDVVSNESGVDNDPLGVEKDTALDMDVACNWLYGETCFNINNAYGYAANVDYWDKIMILVNTNDQTGVGLGDLIVLPMASVYNDDHATLAIHELGHSVGGLSDETALAGRTFVGNWPVEAVNISIWDAVEMAESGEKWARWLGVDDPDFCGLVDAYEGALWYQYGVYRPTEYSMMRRPTYPFNHPSVEGLINRFYTTVRPIDFATPDDTDLTGGETVFVEPVPLVGHAMDVQWFLDDEPLPGATAGTLDLSTLALADGVYGLSVEVVDNTPWVRDPDIRETALTDSRKWQVHVKNDKLAKDALAGGDRLQAANYPNPFNPRTIIRFYLPQAGRVDVRIFDLSGKAVRKLATDAMEAGYHELLWDGRDDQGRSVVSGHYCYRLSDGKQVITERMVLLR